MEKKYCIICGKELQGSQRLYCSNTCKQKGHREDEKKNPNTTFAQEIRGMRRKLKLIEEMGGKCQICGYDKNISALEFHHKDPTQKDFQLDARKMSNTKWETLLEEAKKCDLLCANCHREIHHPEMTKSEINKLKTLGEYNALNKKESSHYKYCLVCGKEMDKSDSRTYCSEECKQKVKLNKFANYPSFEEITNKYSELKSWTKVANFYGLTRKIIEGIRKRAII